MKLRLLMQGRLDKLPAYVILFFSHLRESGWKLFTPWVILLPVVDRTM